MDIKDLKELVADYYKVINEDYLFTEIQKNDILEQLKANKRYFETNAQNFQFVLREMFSQKKRLPLTAVRIIPVVQIFKQDEQTGQFVYYLKIYLQVKHKKETFKEKLMELAILSKKELEDIQIINNEYNISLLPILLESKFTNAEIIHSTCWHIVGDNIIKELEKLPKIY